MEPRAKGTVPFVKMQAIGNDFVLIHDPEDVFSLRWRGLYRWICDRHFGVGADGVILIKPSRKADLRYVHVNADGGVAEMCGNGSRCFVWYAHHVLGLSSVVTFEIDGRTVRGLVDGDDVTVELDPPSEVSLRPGILEETGLEEGGFVTVGVPHYVVYVPAVSSVDVTGLGRKYRFHPEFAQGTNVDFVEVLGPSELRVRTYERGVEAETLGCGTGALAVAVVSHLLGKTGTAVQLCFPGGRVQVQVPDPGRGGMRLSGPAALVFQGELLLPSDPLEFGI